MGEGGEDLDGALDRGEAGLKENGDDESADEWTQTGRWKEVREGSRERRRRRRMAEEEGAAEEEGGVEEEGEVRIRAVGGVESGVKRESIE